MKSWLVNGAIGYLAEYEQVGCYLLERLVLA